jgi:hypothetical protein
MIEKARLRSLLFGLVTNLFIFFCISRSIFMCWPFDPHYNPRRLLRSFNQLSTFLGINAELSLFAPNPPDMVGIVKFIVNFDDGTTEEWAFPRDKMMPWDSELSYRQYVHNALFWTNKRSLITIRPYEARYIARQTATATKRPVRVDFLLAQEPIPPPDEGIGKSLMQPQKYEVFFSYLVKPGDLN